MFEKFKLKFVNNKKIIIDNIKIMMDEIVETIVTCFLLFIKSFKFIKTGITRIKL